jgi:hypothetical protein
MIHMIDLKINTWERTVDLPFELTAGQIATSH